MSEGSGSSSNTTRKLVLLALIGLFLVIFAHTVLPSSMESNSGPPPGQTNTPATTPEEASVNSVYTNDTIRVDIASLGSSKSVYVVRNASTDTPAYYKIDGGDGASDVGDSIEISNVRKEETVKIVAMRVGERQTLKTFNPPPTPTSTRDDGYTHTNTSNSTSESP